MSISPDQPGRRSRDDTEFLPASRSRRDNVTDPSNETALITGASSGIGLELARQFALHGHPVILTAPNESELKHIAATFRNQYGNPVEVIAADLENSYAPRQLFEHLQTRGIEVNILVNNAGHGFRDNFWEIPIEKDVSMIRLNIEALVRLTKLFLPPMLHRGYGRILNTASIAGFEPGPLLAVYHATKAFVLSLSEALSTELEETEVTVTALCPGATDTDFFPKAGMLATRAFQKNKVMAPQDVAKMGYDALMRGDPLYVTGGMNKAMVAARRVMSKTAQARKNKKFYEDVPPEDRKRKRGDIEHQAEKRRKPARV